jgi:hypothetical protein
LGQQTGNFSQVEAAVCSAVRRLLESNRPRQ